ncbi:hypothetical protein GX411_10960 [Candidatus Fermentibacteria bacterium]|nr:hypothetical protein [Candidatus Fermentibacteria bacterium]
MVQTHGCSIEDLAAGMCPGSLVDSERRKRIFSALIERSRASGDSPTVMVDTDRGELALVAVTAIDWPGLASICLGELHYHGWNLDFVEGFAVAEGDTRRGFVLAGIRDSDSARRRKFARDAQKIQGLLEKLAEGRADTLSLLARSSERLEIYEQVRTQLQKLAPGPLPESVTGASGELVLFISSRSDEYLRERRPEDLAQMVLTNIELVEGVRSRGTPQMRLRNIRTTREHLTGINIAAYERDISFQDCLSALSFAWPGSTVRHQRRYTTPDGIISIRIEMTSSTGLAADREELRRIEETLQKLLVKNEIERLKRIHRYGGREHYARALIPLLLRECESTRLPQVYIAPETISTFQAELKLLMVFSAPGIEAHDERVLKLVGSIDKLEGMTVVSFKSPTGYGERWVDIIDITVQRSVYPEMEDAYGQIKRRIEEILGRFRDFDMGMRLNDAKQLREVRALLEDLPDSVITDFYYRLEDFLRASAPVEELAQHIRLAFETMNGALREGRDSAGPVVSVVRNGETESATIFCCVMPEHAHTFQDFLDTVKEYRVTASLIDWSGLNAVLLRVSEQGAALPEEAVARVAANLQSLCRSGHKP